ncbi:MAG TPA: hypothetical protein VGR56_03200 [Nitrososphaerales archaeon]|nr:hypothetical protein [Nitrososphaerales archaeon]
MKSENSRDLPVDDIVVKQATNEDLQSIVSDYGGSESNPFNPFITLERLKRLTRSGLLVAKAGSAYAGFLYWFEASEPRDDTNVDRYARIVEIKVKTW